MIPGAARLMATASPTLRISGSLPQLVKARPETDRHARLTRRHRQGKL